MHVDTLQSSTFRERERDGGKWDCVGEIVGAPVPPRKQLLFQYTISL